MIWGLRYPTLGVPIDEDLSPGTPKPQKQERGEGGTPGFFDKYSKLATASR
jgi:hypothetical protein